MSITIESRQKMKTVNEILYDNYLDREYEQELFYDKCIEIAKEDRKKGLNSIKDEYVNGKKENKGLRIRASYNTRNIKLKQVNNLLRKIKKLDPVELQRRIIEACETYAGKRTTQFWKTQSNKTAIETISKMAFGMYFERKKEVYDYDEEDSTKPVDNDEFLPF